MGSGAKGKLSGYGQGCPEVDSCGRLARHLEMGSRNPDADFFSG